MKSKITLVLFLSLVFGVGANARTLKCEGVNQEADRAVVLVKPQGNQTFKVLVNVYKAGYYENFKGRFDAKLDPHTSWLWGQGVFANTQSHIHISSSDNSNYLMGIHTPDKRFDGGYGFYFMCK